MKKKILMLGGSYFQVPAIQYAKEAGYYVVTADYLPDNPGHQYADEYHNVSTIDKEAIISLAQKLNIDGILSYASDPGAPTAAYVSEKLGLPGNPYESVRILQRKDLFKKFLLKEGFNSPESESFSDRDQAYLFAKDLLNKFCIIIKPVDSSGSRGVTKLTSMEGFDKAFDHAMKYSIVKKIVVEQFIERATYQMDGDGFVWQGRLVFRCFGNQHNDFSCHAHVPSGISFPYTQETHLQAKAHHIIDQIMQKLDMRVGGVNIEYLTDANGEVYVLEIGPRSGGNLIPEVIKFATGVDLIGYSVEGAMGKDCSGLAMVNPKGFYSSYLIHSKKNGALDKIQVKDSLKNNIVKQEFWVASGDEVRCYQGSNDTIGTMILKFDSESEMLEKLDNMNNYINVQVK